MKINRSHLKQNYETERSAKFALDVSQLSFIPLSNQALFLSLLLPEVFGFFKGSDNIIILNYLLHFAVVTAQGICILKPFIIERNGFVGLPGRDF